MSSCEKCWADAFNRSMCDHSKSQPEHYLDLIHEREKTPCTKREQAGQFWDEEKGCDRRDHEPI